MQGGHIALQAAVGLDGYEAALGTQTLALGRDDVDMIRIDLGHDQRHLGIHAEGMAVVDHDGAELDGLRQQLLRDIVAGSAEYDVAALKGLGASFLNHDLLAAELDGLARRTRARQQLELANRKLLLVEALEHLGAHGSRRAQNSNRVLFHASPFKGCGFCPHAEQADYCCQCIQERGGHETRPVETKPKRNAPP